MLCCNHWVATSRVFVFLKSDALCWTMVHNKRYSSVYSSPHSQVSSSSLKPYFIMLALVLATLALNLFKVFHSGHGKCSTNGRCCVRWISSSSCNSFCHLFSLAICGGSCSYFAVCMKLIRDLSLVLEIPYLNIGYRSSFICLVFFMSVVTRLLISGRTIPARRYNLYVGVELIQPVMILQVSFSATDTWLAYLDWLHTGHSYFPVAKYRASPIVHLVCGRYPHWVPASFLSRLFLACILILVLK